VTEYKASVSFEYDLNPVVTVRCSVFAGTWAVAFKKAARAAQKAKPGQRPRSMVVVLELVKPEAQVEGVK
jgi:hypothetical protein